MALFKNIGNDRVQMSAAEEAATRAEWGANEAQAVTDRLWRDAEKQLAATDQEAAGLVEQALLTGTPVTPAEGQLLADRQAMRDTVEANKPVPT